MAKPTLDDAFALMRASLVAVLPFLQAHLRVTKNQAAKKRTNDLILQVREALQAADECE
jgi:hypothetical protein